MHQEHKRAKEAGGRVMPGSGSSWRAPQDVVTETHLEQLKYTDGGGFRFLLRDWLMLREDAIRMGKDPRMVIEFMQQGGTSVRIVLEELP
jgi:hypothetical protein